MTLHIFILALIFFVERGGRATALELKSDAFKYNESIPQKFTCQGEDVSPPLIWTGVPSETQSFALICGDPDAPRGDWTHWVIYDIPADVVELKEGISTQEILDIGAKQGINDFGRIGYNGPCPPPGKPHHYSFRIYCLDKKLVFSPGLSKEALLRFIKGHVLAEAELLCIYRR